MIFQIFVNFLLESARSKHDTHVSIYKIRQDPIKPDAHVKFKKDQWRIKKKID
jgi:hypothetical protein